MAITDFDYVTGQLEIKGIPASLEWSTPQAFIKALVGMVRVRFPVGKGQRFTLGGQETPGSDDTEKMWARVDRNNVPLGWYGFFDGQWRKFYTVAGGEVRWFAGDSLKPPEGWQFIGPETSGISAAVYAKLITLYVPHPDDTPSDRRFQYYAARYIGYRG